MFKIRDESILLEKVIGTRPKVRILSFLYTFDEFDYPASFIAKECSISWNTAKNELEIFVDLGLVEKTRNKGSSAYYRAIKNEIYKAFMELENRVTDKLRLSGNDGSSSQ